MTQTNLRSDALYIAWRFNGEDAECAGIAWNRLSGGVGKDLYGLRSWVIANGEAHALLLPRAPLEQIAEAIWAPSMNLVTTRWIEGKRACARLAREIETVPVSLGLANRPEQWPLSSAARD